MEYNTVVVWSRDGVAFIDNRYSRGHRWLFDGEEHSYEFEYTLADVS